MSGLGIVEIKTPFIDATRCRSPIRSITICIAAAVALGRRSWPAISRPARRRASIRSISSGARMTHAADRGAKSVTRVLPGMVPVTLVQTSNSDPAARIRGDHRPFRLGQIVAALSAGAARPADRGRRADRRPIDHRAWPKTSGRGAAVHLGFVFQFHFLLPEFTVTENVALPMRALGALSRAAKSATRAEELLDSLGLATTGTRCRTRFPAASASAWRWPVRWPTIRRWCSPTSRPADLDTKSSAQVFDLLRSLVDERGKTVVAVTHDLALAARMDRQGADRRRPHRRPTRKRSGRRPERFRATGHPTMVECAEL